MDPAKQERSPKVLPVDGTGLNPHLDAEQTYGDIITHLDLFIVGGAKDCRDGTDRKWSKL